MLTRCKGVENTKNFLTKEETTPVYQSETSGNRTKRFANKRYNSAQRTTQIYSGVIRRTWIREGETGNKRLKSKLWTTRIYHINGSKIRGIYKGIKAEEEMLSLWPIIAFSLFNTL